MNETNSLPGSVSINQKDEFFFPTFLYQVHYKIFILDSQIQLHMQNAIEEITLKHIVPKNTERNH